MRGKKVYCIIRTSWDGRSYTFDDAFIYENEEDRDNAYEEMLARQKALKDYDLDYQTYETEIE